MKSLKTMKKTGKKTGIFKSSQNSFIKRYSAETVFAVIIVVCGALIFNIVSLIANYSTQIEEQSQMKAEYYNAASIQSFSDKSDVMQGSVSGAAEAISSLKDEEAFKTYLERLQTNEGIGEYSFIELCYFTSLGGDEYKMYDYAGNLLSGERKSEAVFALAQKREAACSGVVYNYVYNTIKDPWTAVAFYSPITDVSFMVGGENLNGLVFVYPLSELISINSAKADNLNYAESSVVCSSDGVILNVLKGEDFRVNGSFFDVLKSKTQGGELSDELKNTVASGASGAFTVYLQGKLHTVAVGVPNSVSGKFFVASVYDSQDIYSSGYTLMNTIWVTVAIVLLFVIGFSVYFIVTRLKNAAAIKKMEETDQSLKCPAYKKFEKEAEAVLAANKATRFAVIVVHLAHMQYIIEKFGGDSAHAALERMRDVLAGTLTRGESYGYLSDGEFVVLYHYREREWLIDRLKGVYVMIHKFSCSDGVDDYRIKAKFGIYETEKSGVLPVSQMTDKARLAARLDVSDVCRFYGDNMRRDYMLKADIESRMEPALAAGEFRVFYQPQYSLTTRTVDGAELLVRWYDPEAKRFRNPAEFMPVFESNGFISRLDRYVYWTACENLAEDMKKSVPLNRISVNISRVTAAQPDFVKYYAGVKQKFGIKDGVITLEFTESFAYENYEYLAKIIDELHANGFLCSLDDFGTGYSSYHVLKTLALDEIKLDKFFIDRGVSAEVDEIVIRDVIGLVKRLNMKVVQEGVERFEDIARLREYGCDVIQGYCFAKPMNVRDSRAFIAEIRKVGFDETGEK